MDQRLRRRAVVVALTLTLGMLSLVPQLVAAAPDNGAIVETTPIGPEEYCTVLSATVMYCYSLHGVIHMTTTPSGNLTHSAAGKLCITKIDQGTVVYDYCRNVAFQDFAKDGVYPGQVSHTTSMSRYVTNGESCTFRAVFQVANGEMRISHFYVECQPL